MTYTAILLSEDDFELAIYEVRDPNPIRFVVMLPTTEFEGHRHPSRPETMVRSEVIFYVDHIETELAQMMPGSENVLIYRTRTPSEIHWDNEDERVF